MTQIEAARLGRITEALRSAAAAEGRRAEELLPLVADGRHADRKIGSERQEIAPPENPGRFRGFRPDPIS